MVSVIGPTVRCDIGTTFRSEKAFFVMAPGMHRNLPMILIELVEPALERVPEATAAATIRTMLDRKVDVGVVLEQKRPRGIVTEKELVERLATLPDADGAQLQVTDVMRPVETAAASTATVDA